LSKTNVRRPGCPKIIPYPKRGSPKFHPRLSCPLLTSDDAFAFAEPQVFGKPLSGIEQAIAAFSRVDGFETGDQSDISGPHRGESANERREIVADQVQALDQHCVIVPALDATKQGREARTTFGGIYPDRCVVTMHGDDVPTTISGESPEIACLFVGSEREGKGRS
jgi:hypothetical protein